ncbi:MAG: class I SAM-dependent methyltransferase [Lachnospiraceae bacterium]|nr:class I SAM-dependent methyltransferase [Lachnospiraceae bacterium]
MNKKTVFEQLAQLSYLPLYEKVLTASLELDVYSHLCEKTTAEILAKKLGWNAANTSYFLEGLTALGFVMKDGNLFYNSDEAEKYLVKGKPEYLGGFIQYYSANEGSMPFEVVKLVTEGPQPMQQQANEQSIDFVSMGAMMRQAQEGYRQQELLDIVRSLPENKTIKSVLDLGCATGLLGMSVVKDNDERTGTFIDLMPSEIVMESAEQMGLSDRVKVMNGNFLTDDIGGGYDLILAVSVALFAKGNMNAFLKKCYDALNPGGVMLVISEGIEMDHTGPWDMVMGYLPYYMQGMNMGVQKNEVSDEAKRIGFAKCEKRTEMLCSGTQDIDILRK